MKAVVCARIGGKDVLISGSADKSIIVWDINSGSRLHKLQDTTQSMLAVHDLVVDPVETTEEAAYLMSASSDPLPPALEDHARRVGTGSGARARYPGGLSDGRF